MESSARDRRAWTFRPPKEQQRTACPSCRREWSTHYEAGKPRPPLFTCPMCGQMTRVLEEDTDGEESPA